MKQSLSEQKCVPCEGNVKPFTKEQFSHYLSMTPDWHVEDDSKIIRDFKFKNFKHAIAFVNQIAEIAESEGHHPDIHLHNWNKVLLTLTTHAIKGLSLNDFILASKIDQTLIT